VQPRQQQKVVSTSRQQQQAVCISLQQQRAMRISLQQDLQALLQHHQGMPERHRQQNQARKHVAQSSTKRCLLESGYA